MKSIQEIKVELELQLADEKFIQGEGDNANTATPCDVRKWAFNIKPSRWGEGDCW
jgi:hypothetical protein